MAARALFADAFYWVALILPRDSQHVRVLSFSQSLRAVSIVTTDEVLTEVLNHFSHFGSYWRFKAAELVRDLRRDAQITVLPQTRTDFDAALALYEARLDKEYSLVDCRSMVAMRSLGLTEVLSNDRHFEQEGFTVLFP
jgi:uncharacterized protein